MTISTPPLVPLYRVQLDFRTITSEVCRSFAVSHKLEFNASKTQLIRFYAPSVAPITPSIYFNSTLLSYSNQVVHLGHILTNNLNDTMDIMRVVKDLNRKANFVLCTFHAADPFVKTFLLQSYCLSLYGCCLWSLNSPSISLIEIALNKILRKIWHLPPHSHTAIVHCVAQVDTISNLLYKRFQSFLSRSLSSSSPLINTIFNESSYCIYSFTALFGHKYIRVFNNEDFCIASTIRLIRSIHGLYSPLESTIVTLSC